MEPMRKQATNQRWTRGSAGFNKIDMFGFGTSGPAILQVAFPAK